MRSLEELTVTDDPAWPIIQDLMAAALTPAQGINVFPPPWSAEGRGNLAGASRRAVPMRELLGLAADFLRQMGPGDPGFLGQA